MKTLRKAHLFALLSLFITVSSHAAQDFRLVLFYQEGIDDPYVKAYSAVSFQKALQDAGPLGSDFSIRFEIQPYALDRLVDCVKTRYSEPSIFPELVPKAQMLRNLAILVASQRRLSAKLTTVNPTEQLSAYIHTRWTLRVSLEDAMVVCFRQDAKYSTRSISYPVFYLLVPGFKQLLAVGFNSGKPSSLPELLDIIRKTQRQAMKPEDVWAFGETFNYHPSEHDPMKRLKLPPKIIELSPHVGIPIPVQVSDVAHTVVHELGHYLSLPHVNTDDETLAKLSPGWPLSDHSAKRCASLVVFGPGNSWRINDRDYLMSEVTDTSSLLTKTAGDLIITIQADANAAQACFQAQKDVITAHGAVGTLFLSTINTMSYGLEGGAIMGTEWSASQKQIAQSKARDLLRAAAGP